MPASHRHLSVDELSHRASTGLAIRRGDIKISDPIPSSYVHHGIERDQAYEQRTPRMDTTVSWSGRSGPGALHGRSGSAPLSSHPAHSSKFTERTSLGPSLSTSNMSSTPLKGSPMPKKDIGFRASLKRMFSKKSAAATAQKRSAHQSVRHGEYQAYLFNPLIIVTGSRASPSRRQSAQGEPLPHGVDAFRCGNTGTPSAVSRDENSPKRRFD